MERARRWGWWLLGAVVVVAVALVLIVPRLLDSDALRHEIEARLSAALGREVTIERVDVEPGEGAVTLYGVRVADPPELGDGALLVAESVRLDVELQALRHRAIEGAMRAEGVTLRVLRSGGRTNLHGLGNPDRARDKGEPVPLALAVELVDARVEVVDDVGGEQVILEGVGLRGHVGAAAGDKSAELALTIAAAQLDLLRVTDIEIDGRFEPEALDVTRIAARLGHAEVSGQGRLQLTEGKPADWSAALAIADAEIDADLLPIVFGLFPPLAATQSAFEDVPEGTSWGRLSLAVSLRGTGIRWPATRATMSGEGHIELTNVIVGAQTLVGRIAKLAGHEDGNLELARGRAEFGLADEWVTLRRLEAEGAMVVPPVTGRVALDGRLDLEVDLMPLVKAYGGGVYAKLSGISSTIPVRVGGTVSDPDIKPPKATSVAKGLLGGLRNRNP